MRPDEQRRAFVGVAAYPGAVSPEREELRKLVEDLPDEQVPAVLDELRRRLRRVPAGQWPPAWFGAARGGRSDTARRADDILAEGFGRSG